MNKVELIGRLTKDVVLNKTNSGLSTCTITLAIDRPVKSGAEKQTDFPRVVIWGKQAENCAKYLAKGMLVAIVGRLQTGSFQNKDGVTVYTCDVNAEEVQFLEWKDKGNQQPNASMQGMPAAQGYAPVMPVAQAPVAGQPMMSQPAPPAVNQPMAGQPAMQPPQAPVANQPMMGQQQALTQPQMNGYPQQQTPPNGFTVTGNGEYDNF